VARHPLLVNIWMRDSATDWWPCQGQLPQGLSSPLASMTSALRIPAGQLAHLTAGLIFLHNHPSSDPQPSQEDIQITERLSEVGKVVGIRVLDHIVIGQDCYFSFADQGLLS